MAELVTWCRIFRVGLPCAKPCEDCRKTSRRMNVEGLVDALRAPDPSEEDCQASHCPPSAYQDCDWPRCAERPTGSSASS